MKTILISGSRNRAGQTASAAQAFVDGCSGGGGEVEQVFLPEMNIERCRQCEDNGWGLCRTEGRCIIEDDFAGLVKRIRAADSVVFATPVYFGDLSESLKAFLDRLRRTCWKGDGAAGIAGKPAIGICVAGGGGGGAPMCAQIMDRTLTTCGFDVRDVIPARRQNLPVKLAVLRTVGRWFAEHSVE